MDKLKKIKLIGTVTSICLALLGTGIDAGCKVYVAVMQSKLNDIPVDPAKIAATVVNSMGE